MTDIDYDPGEIDMRIPGRTIPGPDVQTEPAAPSAAGVYFTGEHAIIEKLEAFGRIIDNLGALARQNPEPQSSVELSQTAKGLTTATVKVYAADPFAASEAAQELYDNLVAKYKVEATP